MGWGGEGGGGRRFRVGSPSLVFWRGQMLEVRTAGFFVLGLPQWLVIVRVLVGPLASSFP